MNPNEPRLLRKQRSIPRAFARFAETEDGKLIIAFLEKQVNWDEAGPANPTEDSLLFWTGQRSVVKLIRDNTSTGKKLLADPDTDDDE